MHRWLQTMLLLLLLLLGVAGGCATQSPSINTGSDAWSKPADQSNLRLFDVKSQGDFLVVYDEYSGLRDSVHPRAYFMKQNDRRILQDRAPRFVSTNLAFGFPTIPVFKQTPSPGTNQTQTLFAILTTNEPSFTIYQGGRDLGSHQLPVYPDRKGAYEETASSVAGKTADMAIGAGAIGGSMALMALWVFAQSGYGFTAH
jgi:hypothetical protein